MRSPSRKRYQRMHIAYSLQDVVEMPAYCWFSSGDEID